MLLNFLNNVLLVILFIFLIQRLYDSFLFFYLSEFYESTLVFHVFFSPSVLSFFNPVFLSFVLVYINYNQVDIVISVTYNHQIYVFNFLSLTVSLSFLFGGFTTDVSLSIYISVYLIFVHLSLLYGTIVIIFVSCPSIKLKFVLFKSSFLSVVLVSCFNIFLLPQLRCSSVLLEILYMSIVVSQFETLSF